VPGERPGRLPHLPALPGGAPQADPDNQHLDRNFEESLRRTKVIPQFPWERACLTLVFATLITAAEKWRGVQMTPKILQALEVLRAAGTPQQEQAAA